jgi:6-pyruvoyltetrahydropterin/6-carboxytetrahydropterin synthase
MTAARHSITVEHNFETAHRLPHLPGKCRSLHGHSWRVAVTVNAPTLSGSRTVVEFGRFKKLMRGWIDEHLDHGTMLGLDDPLVAPLRDAGCKVFTFGSDVDGRGDWEDSPWPTVESVAELLARQAWEWLAASRTGPADTTAESAGVARVDVAETAVNRASWGAV